MVFRTKKPKTNMEEQTVNLSGKALEDFHLVQQALSGNEKAFTRLLSRYKDSVYFMLLKMVNNRTDAEDLTLEAFGKAFKNLHQYVPSYAFSTWLFKIASNNCIDFLRKAKGTEFVSDNSQNQIETLEHIRFKAKDPNPEERLIRIQRAILLRKIVYKLKPRYQQLIELRYFQEYSYEEIAKELNLPIGTIKAQLFRAREILFAMIGSTEMGETE